MPTPDGPMVASFVGEHREELITAALIVIATFVLAEIVDRALKDRARRLGERVAGRELSPGTSTRLRLARRLIFVSILVIGFALALGQFPAVTRVAMGVLASSALLGLIVGFAARQTLANAIAGVSLAIAEPIRVGDIVTFEGETGEVEDVRLAYTSIRCEDGRRLVVPNERLAQAPIVNHTLIDPGVQVETEVWLSRDVDVDAALAVFEGEGMTARIAEIAKDGIRLSVTVWAHDPRAREAEAARLRHETWRLLRTEGLS